MVELTVGTLADSMAERMASQLVVQKVVQWDREQAALLVGKTAGMMAAMSDQRKAAM